MVVLGNTGKLLHRCQTGTDFISLGRVCRSRLPGSKHIISTSRPVNSSGKSIISCRLCGVLINLKAFIGYFCLLGSLKIGLKLRIIVQFPCSLPILHLFGEGNQLESVGLPGSSSLQILNQLPQIALQKAFDFMNKFGRWVNCPQGEPPATECKVTVDGDRSSRAKIDTNTDIKENRLKIS